MTEDTGSPAAGGAYALPMSPSPAGAKALTAAALGPGAQMVAQPRGFDLFRLPGMRRLARWKYSRLLFQLPLLLLALLAIFDGLTGSQFASRNLATTSTWLHYRGLIVIAVALVGNAFCAACPLLLTRGLSRRLERLMPNKLAWPRALRSKWLVVGLLLAFFLSYEVFDLWASPWLTAWLAIGYFAAVLAVDTLFPAGTFCRYLCPLGNFNFALSTVSPTQIAAVDVDICRSCEHKPCLHGRYSAQHDAPAAGGKELAFIPLAAVVNPNGSGRFPGCETDLFVPTIVSNMDCTYCFNCVRACPYDNVALSLRQPGAELARAPWLRRGRLAALALVVLLACWGFMNALAMTPLFFDSMIALGGLIGSSNEALLLAVLYGLVTIAGVATLGLAGVLADLAGGAKPRARAAFERWGYVAAALGFGVWAAHYLFHFLTGALAIVPVFQHLFDYRGLDWDPSWRLVQLVPSRWLFPVQAGITAFAGALAMAATVRIALRDFGRRGALAMWPMLLYVLAFTAVVLTLWAQPMEMRGTIFGPLP